jgi:ubiquinone/menaquinone biosynthesis C-methylase UbiE
MSDISMSKEEIEKTKRNYDKVADFFEERTQEMQINDIDRFIEMVKTGKNPKILDIGCGPGRDASTFVKQDIDVVGVDISEEMLNIARNKVPEATFKKMDMRNLYFNSETFDGVWSAGSLQHIPKSEMDDLLSNIHSILKDGGIFFSDLREGEGEILEETNDYGEVIQRFMVYWQKDEFIQYLKDAGFEILSAKAVEEEWSDTGEKRDFRKIRIFSEK